MMQDQIGIPACFSLSSSAAERHGDDSSSSAGVTRSGQSVFMSVYRTKIADECRFITVTWCKNLLLHGLSVTVETGNGGGDGGESQHHHHHNQPQHTCKVELKPWYFWRKHGSKRFMVKGKQVDIFWDLKSAKFNGETEPSSEYYVAVVCDEEVVLLLGDLKKDAYRRTGCRPSLIDPILVSRKEHIFGKKKFVSRAKFHEKGRMHEISIECRNRTSNSSHGNYSLTTTGFDPEMEIRIDGNLLIHVKHLQWKFRGNESIHLNKLRLEVYWDVHDWLFSPGLRHALFIFKPNLLSFSSPPPHSQLSSSSSPPLSSSPLSSQTTASSSSGSGSFEAFNNPNGSSDFCLFLYAWKVE